MSPSTIQKSTRSAERLPAPLALLAAPFVVLAAAGDFELASIPVALLLGLALNAALAYALSARAVFERRPAPQTAARTTAPAVAPC